MKYLLDSDTIIYYLNGDNNIAARVANVPTNKLCTSTINQAELFYGAHNSKHVRGNIDLLKRFLTFFEIVAFEEESANAYGKIKSILNKRGELIADMDLCIAAVAMVNKMILVTNNSKHFARIEGLKLENWREK
jgi:tRNA(fMet)-specific endonuclease VapC